MKDPLRVLQMVCGIALIAAIGFSWIWALSFYNRIAIYRSRELFQSQTFVVRDAVYSSDGEAGTSYWLDGTVNGREERLVPDRRGAAFPKSKREVLFKYPKGTVIPVLYNPDASTTLVQFESLRVIEAAPDFWEKEAERRHRLAWRVLLPIPLTLGLYLGVRFARRRRESQQGDPC